MPHSDDPLAVPTAAPPLPRATTAPASAQAEAATSAPDLPEVSRRWIWLLVAAQFGVFMAFITPIAISLAIRVNDLAPGHEEYLGYITGVGALVVMLTGPLLGVASDRTRSRLGRRRPFILVGMTVGVVSLVVMALAPSVLVLALGWILAQLGWGQALGGLANSQADRLPEFQRGKVAGLGGVATQIAPVFGVLIAGGMSGNPLLLFLIPGVFGVIGALLFVLFAHEDDSRGLQFPDRMTAKTLLSKYVYNPRRFPDFSWNWLGRFLFYFGLTLNTTFTAFFFAFRLGVPVDQVGGTIAVAGGIGVLATTTGAIGGGLLSDKIKRRKPLIVFSGTLMAVGMLTMAFAGSIVLLIAGSVIVSMGLGGFAAVDQALLLDVLPERETDAGRYMGIVGFAASIPQAVAPLIAPLILGIGAFGGEKNYTLLFSVAAGFVLVGGLVVLRIRSVR